MSKEKSKKDAEKSKENSEEEISEEESNLEEKIEISDEKINSKQFQDFIENDFSEIPQESQESDAPVLEIKNSPQGNTFVRLEENLSKSTSFQENKKDENEFNYNPSEQKNNGEPKYSNYADEVLPMRNISLENLGKNSFQERQEIEWKSSRDNFESSNIEKYVPAKFQDIQNLGKGNPFEKKEIKYNPSNH